MKTLKDYARYLRESRLRDFTVYYLAQLKEKEADIPILKLAVERGLVKDLWSEETFERTMLSQVNSLQSLEDGTALPRAKESLKLWEQNKIPGITRDDIFPADIIQIYAILKNSIFHFLPDYTGDLVESLSIVKEVEDLYTDLQNEAMQMLFKIQKSTQEQLQETETIRQRLLAIIEASTDFIGFADIKDRHIMYMNRNGRKMLGIAENEDAQKFKVNDVHPAWVNEKLEKECIPHAIQNGIWKGETAFLTQEGKEVPVSMILMAHKKPDGEVDFISTVSRDIRDQKIAEQQLISLNKELERSNSELEQFAYVASHDLQEPLRTISSYVQLLAERYRDKIDKDANEFIDFAVDGSNRMRLLINSLLEYSRVNKIKPYEVINPSAIIREVLQDMNDQVTESEAMVKFKDLPEIYGDPVLIGQLFQNLIGNAIKFRGEKKPEIKIAGKRENGEYKFSVEDNGIGIQPEYAEKIFVIFQRLNSREKYPGTGIGLSICKKIVERHGGKIWVESKPGKGSTFYFTIKADL